MTSRRIPAPLEPPSLPTILNTALSALTMGLLTYPFAFDAFGRADNPFDRPYELAGIGLLAVCWVPAIAVIIITRRIVGPLVSRHRD